MWHDTNTQLKDVQTTKYESLSGASNYKYSIDEIFSLFIFESSVHNLGAVEEMGKNLKHS